MDVETPVPLATVLSVSPFSVRHAFSLDEKALVSPGATAILPVDLVRFFMFVSLSA